MAEPIYTKPVSVPTSGGSHVMRRVKVPAPAPTPVRIVGKPKPSIAKQTVTRLGTPSAFVLLLGLGLVYYAIHGWDRKYGTFNGAFAGKGNIPAFAGKGNAPGGTASTVSPSQSNAQTRATAAVLT